ncbi:acyl-ACP thioesterase domain-containing protein [Actinomycetospora soli]|uniref:acyl-ACP thioesterase domain-containing protein n=1 Tax=Actinomycetospora soli TaxID=2893887 RepID=UPI001E3A7251|nr:acyl-ACP thioesterase domain-containing protein [Actinomycetospora soli]MCD2187459.1 thioesterase [Actinomycetospora soli]
MPESHPAALTHPAAYPSLRDVSPRYSDLGPDGTISATGLTRWFEDVRVGTELPAFRRLVEDGEFGAFRVLLAAQTVQRLDRMPFDGKYRIGLGIRRIGGSSFTYGYAVFCDDRCVALGSTVTVFATEAGPAHLPDALRADLGGMVLDEPDAAAPYQPGPERRDRSAYPFAVALRARVGDIDTNRHVNNVTLVSWYADGVASLHDELLTPGWGGPPPELAPSTYRVQYVAEVGYPAQYEIGVAVLAVDGETVTYGLGVFLGDRCVGLADAVGPRGDLDAAALDAWRMITA